jgi:hypothetical protein
MTPPEIRNALVLSGVDMDKYSNPMVVLHNTLKRFHSQGEVTIPEGKPTRYQWAGSVGRALALEPPPQYGPNRTAIANMTNAELLGLEKPKRKR